MGNTPSFERNTCERVLLEAYVKVCIQEHRKGNGAIKLGVAYKGTGFYLYFQFEAPPHLLPGLIPPLQGAPEKFRVYFEVTEMQEHTVADKVCTVDVPDDDFIRYAKGAVLTSEYLGVTLHCCSGGAVLLFDESIYPYLSFSILLGPSNPRINPFEGSGNIYATPLRQELGRHISLCIQWFLANQRAAIRVGSGSREGFTLFIDFTAQEGVDGNPPKRPVRVYVSIPEAEKYQVMCIDPTLLPDEDFVQTEGGRIFGPNAIGVKLHACPCGVFLYYNESEGDFRSVSLGIGKAGLRKNKYAKNAGFHHEVRHT